MTPQVAPFPVGHIPAAAVADQDMEDSTMLDDDGSDIDDDDDDMGDDSGDTQRTSTRSHVWMNYAVILGTMLMLLSKAPCAFCGWVSAAQS